MPPIRKNKSKNSGRPMPKQSSESQVVVSGQLDKKLKKQQEKNDNKRGIVFIKHLPHGFFEEQLKNYFEQFGAVTRLRLGRSRRTGGSKGYAFVEFAYPEVAEVAAETMDNYLMFKKVVKAAYIPPEKQLYNYFKTSVRKVKNKAGRDIYVSHKTAAIHRKVKQMNNWSDKNYQKRALKKLEKVKKLNEKYAHLGIDFSKVLIEPNKIVNDNDSETKSTKVNEENSTAITGKRKSKGAIGDANKKSKKSKDLELQDLLGNTINDDSEDEDYVASSQSGNESAEENDSDDGNHTDGVSTSSDEETYGFTNDSEDEENSSKAQLRKNTKKGAIPFSKSVKGPKVDPLEKLIKRKPLSGAVQKAKKALKPTVSKKTQKSIAQVTAAKEILKTMPSKKVKTVGLKSKSSKTKKIRK
ncbi:MKI67 FHA domain-interacting nucleolar phosphoprotein [Anastrepha obliqua]|uniref:MKI67 FHA domain-interacting nucleolar phosphoprotein n=1 Tax=Anastrepha obliqua TaxID=95512 RepID=UPI002409B670|nr:MKI67 FHA domain-interacting nucleolar phosphoprotein [Anastrepha obliqua]